MASNSIQEYNFTVHQGGSLSVRLCLAEGDGTATDLTDYTVRGSIKHRYGDSSPLLPILPVIATPATSGYIDVILTATVTKNLPIGQMVYDIEKHPNNNPEAVVKVVKGYFNIYPEATNE